MTDQTILATLSLLSVTSFTSAYAGNQSPNIILIMADDLGWGDTGFNGHEHIKTPNMDKLASDGVIFDRFYSASAVSSPTRFSVLTGRNPYRSGIFTANKGILRQEEITIPEMIKAKGYRSGHFGKWHLGTLTDQEPDANRGKAGNSAELNPPRLHGYDDSFVTESKVPTYDPMLSPVKKTSGKFWDSLQEGEPSKSYGTSYWKHDGSKATENLSGDDSRVIMDRVIPFIDESAKADSPFFCAIWFHAPHLPCVAGPKHQAMYKDYPLDKRNFYGCISAMDEQIGRLVDELKQRGEYDNTLILFCSDNGPEGKTNAPGTTGGLKGRKRSLFEGGVRVPAFAVWPDKIELRGRISTPAFTSDYLPTIKDLLSINDASHQLDGESLLPLLTEGRPRTKPMVFLIGNQATVVDNKYKLYHTKGTFSLFDIENDRAELYDIALEHPELVKKYKDLLEDHLDHYNDSFEGREFVVDNKFEEKWSDPMRSK